MILAIGEILFDIFPGYKRLGGAPFNFAMHLKNFGYPVRFISRVGNDSEGEEIKEYIKRIGFDLNDIQTDNRNPTGKVIVKLDEKGVPEFNILSNAAYDSISYDHNIELAMREKIDMIYIGTLIQRSENGFRTVQKILACKDKSTKCFYDVNLRPNCYNDEIIKSTLQHADILKLNHEELLQIKEMFGISGDEEEFLQFLFKNHSTELIAVTRGEKGSSIYTAEKDHSVFVRNTWDIEDTVGAGDAFASVMAIGYLKGWDISKINTTASDFATIICSIKGAIPQDLNIYDVFKINF